MGGGIWFFLLGSILCLTNFSNCITFLLLHRCMRATFCGYIAEKHQFCQKGFIWTILKQNIFQNTTFKNQKLILVFLYINLYEVSKENQKYLSANFRFMLWIWFEIPSLSDIRVSFSLGLVVSQNMIFGENTEQFLN